MGLVDSPVDHQEAAARIRIEIGDLGLRFAGRTSPRPKRLFHYTSQAGLLGIITSNVLWATNVLYLNDSSELAYGLSIAERSCGPKRRKVRRM
jgi:hypothetical protein